MIEVKKKFVYPDKQAVKDLVASAKISELEASVFINRGIVSTEAVMDVKNKNLSNLRNPLEMKDARIAADTIVKHINQHHEIVVYSDYDADGWGAAVVGYKMLTEMGGTVHVFTNTRDMGYGACVAGIDKILADWPETKLIVTSDNGIVAFEAIDYAISKGLEVVVTDHHMPSKDGKLTAATANVNPHRFDDAYKCKELCGAGVLWKVLSICYVMKGIPSPRAYEVLDIVATATVADVVPLVDENRIIVKYGLQMISDNCRPQWIAFKKVFGDYRPIIQVDARTISFSFGPGINAMSRMKGTIEEVIDMFVNPHTEEELLKIAEHIKAVNEERKTITKDYTSAAMVLADARADLSVIVINHEELFEGVVGLVAGRIREAVNKPTIVLTKDENGNWRGSGRSIPGFPIKDVLDDIQSENPIIKAYGGHAQACGLTTSDENLHEFIDMLLVRGDKLPEEAFIKHIPIDYVAGEGDINNEMYDTIRNLEPFGNSFEEPTIMVKNIYPEKVVTMGSDGQHISFKCKGFSITSWYGSCNVDLDKVDDIQSVSAVGRLEKDDWGIKLMVDPTEFKVFYS